MPQASTDKEPEVVIDTVYQLQLPNGDFKKKYVKTVRTYGEDDDIKAETKVVLDRNDPSQVGETQVFSTSLLAKPDTYPHFMYQPHIWQAKATQNLTQVKAEAEAILESWFRTSGITASFDLKQDADMVVNSIKEMLSGYFGPFMLGMIAHWIKGKISDRLDKNSGGIKPMPFERKLGSIKRELAERKQNLATPMLERGQFNQQHPFGKPREVEQFGQQSA